MSEKLTPPDHTRCQAEFTEPGSFMQLGGSPRMTRCKNVPTRIATEKHPGADGQCGSMSLCDDCYKVFLEKMGEGYADFTPVKKVDHGK